jgi:hypothetical protein
MPFFGEWPFQFDGPALNRVVAPVCLRRFGRCSISATGISTSSRGAARRTKDLLYWLFRREGRNPDSIAANNEGFRMKWNLHQLTRTVPLLIAQGEAGEMVREFSGRIYSNRISYLLRRDTSIPYSLPEAKIPIVVRPVHHDDIPVILRERPVRVAALESGLSTCYVATTEENEICYMQWLIDSSQNELIARQFNGLCPPLSQNEMLLEWAYTFKRFRGLGIMGRAMAQISEKGAEAGARWLFTFVAVDNVASLKGCKNAGFRPFQIRTEKWWFLRSVDSFEDLPANAKYPFEEKH